MKKRLLLLSSFLLGYLAYPAIGYLFPPLTFGYWKLACTSEVAFSVVGMGGDFSQQFLVCSRINESLSPAISYRLLFLVGTPAAKCHALVGLRQFDRAHFEEYVKRLEVSNESVIDRWMDMGMQMPVSKIANGIRLYDENVLTAYQRDYQEWINQRREREYQELEKQKKKYNQALESTGTKDNSKIERH